MIFECCADRLFICYRKWVRAAAEASSKNSSPPASEKITSWFRPETSTDEASATLSPARTQQQGCDSDDEIQCLGEKRSSESNLPSQEGPVATDGADLSDESAVTSIRGGTTAAWVLWGTCMSHSHAQGSGRTPATIPLRSGIPSTHGGVAGG